MFCETCAFNYVLLIIYFAMNGFYFLFFINSPPLNLKYFYEGHYYSNRLHTAAYIFIYPTLTIPFFSLVWIFHHPSLLVLSTIDDQPNLDHIYYSHSKKIEHFH